MTKEKGSALKEGVNILAGRPKRRLQLCGIKCNKKSSLIVYGLNLKQHTLVPGTQKCYHSENEGRKGTNGKWGTNLQQVGGILQLKTRLRPSL